MRELRATLQQQAHELQVILVPPHRDAVLGYSAETGHYAVIQVLEQLFRIAHGRGGIKSKRLDLKTIDRYHGVAIVHKVMCQGKTRRTETDDQHLAPCVREWQRTTKVERIPA